MKALLKKGLVILLLLALSMLFSCDIYIGEKSLSDLIGTSNTDQTNNGENTNADVMLIHESVFYDSPNKYVPIDSYAIDGGYYYYFYYLGAIDAVPLGLESSSGVYFNGVPTTLEFSLTTITSEDEQKIIEDSVENNFSFISADYDKTNLSADIKIFEAEIETGVVNADITGISNTSTQSYIESISKQTSFEQSISYEMTEDNPAGYYFYTPMASVKVYAVVAYNPYTECVEYATTYNQYGMALPGIYYSPFSFITLSNFNIEFDKSHISSFTPPQETISGEYFVELNANGGNVDTNTLNVHLGKPYGVLPTPQKKGYQFIGWYVDGRKVDEYSIATSSKPLEAKWMLLTSYCFNYNSQITVSSIYKLNPFLIGATNFNGETNKEGLGMTDIFDISALKAENYKMKVTVKCDGRIPKVAIKGLNFNFNIYSNGKKIIPFTHNISAKQRGKTVGIELISNEVPLDLVTGNLSFDVSTENILDLELKNIQIYIDFVK